MTRNLNAKRILKGATFDNGWFEREIWPSFFYSWCTWDDFVNCSFIAEISG